MLKSILIAITLLALLAASLVGAIIGIVNNNMVLFGACFATMCVWGISASACLYVAVRDYLRVRDTGQTLRTLGYVET